MLTIFLPTTPDLDGDAYVTESDALEVGDLVDMGEVTKEFQIVSQWLYAPLGLYSKPIALAIVNPLGEIIPPPEKWYCWDSKSDSPRQSYHIIKHGDSVVSASEKPAGQEPEIGKELYRYASKEVGLDRVSIEALMRSLQKIPRGLVVESFATYRNPDAPYANIYVAQTVKVSSLQVA